MASALTWILNRRALGGDVPDVWKSGYFRCRSSQNENGSLSSSEKREKRRMAQTRCGDVDGGGMHAVVSRIEKE